ncbi:pilus assembly protein PilP [Psychromonas sp. psych-6C06]|uniref:pilus assembly protein PilP n=1 Tax=Psychromonas sp. psych-6C06 TaxID=2058089 RepID=UPI000C31F5F1|nr:pilus assembly protein PilP [Psychromonas sp. psych-6C06]PKF61482.1 pilus assembly protein PilP [Psychromonas sp. psych-6C06]
MRILITLFLSFSLFSCVEVKTDDLNAFVVDAKSKVYPINDKIPELKKIDALAFTGDEYRNPFTKPKAEVVAPVKNAPKSCPQPNFKRKKQALEMYSLDNLLMRGTLLINEELWALVQVSGGEIHKVRPGYYLGLNHGKVLKITKAKIELLELASDKDGCWQERITQITLQSQ